MDTQYYASPRTLRAALDGAGGDWTQVLSPAQLDQALPPTHWGGHTTLRSWLEDGATRHEAAQVWPLVCPPERRPGGGVELREKVRTAWVYDSDSQTLRTVLFFEDGRLIKKEKHGR